MPISFFFHSNITNCILLFFPFLFLSVCVLCQIVETNGMKMNFMCACFYRCLMDTERRRRQQQQQQTSLSWLVEENFFVLLGINLSIRFSLSFIFLLSLLSSSLLLLLLLFCKQFIRRRRRNSRRYFIGVKENIVSIGKFN